MGMVSCIYAATRRDKKLRKQNLKTATTKKTRGAAEAERKKMSRSLDVDAIYYASLPVVFASVPGEMVPFVASEWAEDPASIGTVLQRFHFQKIPTPELYAAARAAAESKGGVGGAYKSAAGAAAKGEATITVPAVPALDLVRTPSAASGDALAALPAALRAPLIKVRESEAPPGALRGVASGTRSALVKIEGVWYRLKGCGNNDEGFTVRSSAVQKLGPDAAGRRTETLYDADGKVSFFPSVDARGAAFPWTAARELVMSGRLAAALAPFDAASANLPVASMSYTGAAQNPLGAGSPTACIVERTLGDRRLGSHLLAGLELLLPLLLCDEEGAEGSLAGGEGALRTAFPSARPTESGAPIPTALFVGDHVLASFYSFQAPDIAEAMLLKPFYDPAAGLEGAGWALPRDGSTMANLPGNAAAHDALKAAERAANVSRFVPQQFTREGPRPMAPEWLPLWTQAVGEYAAALKALPAGGASLLAYMFSRLGDDAGTVIRGVRFCPAHASCCFFFFFF